MKSVRVPMSVCPECGQEHDSATSINDAKEAPEEGDLSICSNCAAVLTFNADLTLQIASDDYINKLPAKSKFELCTAIATINLMKEERDNHD